MTDPSNLLSTPIRPSPRSRSNTSTSTAQLISPSLLRIASSSSTSTVKLSSEFAGQSISPVESREGDLQQEHGKERSGDGSSGEGGLTVPPPLPASAGGSVPGSKPPSVLSRRSTVSAATGTSNTNVFAGSTLASGSGAGKEAASGSGRSSPARSSLSEVGVGSGMSDENVMGQDAKTGLRRLMSSSMSRLEGQNGGVASAKGKERASSPEHTFTPRRYYVLTHAGKPVFSCPEEDGDSTTNMMGVIQAIISIYSADGDRIRTICRGKRKISFLLRPPIFLFCISDWDEPEFVLKYHSEYIHLQILSTVTEVQIRKVFQRQSNFDLRRLLEGTEFTINNLIHDLQTDMTFMTSALQPMRLPPGLRDVAGQALVPPSKMHDLLYVLLLVNDKVVTLLRPRKHSIHPTDLHLLLNTLKSSPGLRSSETWLPMCLPKFNANGFVYALIDYVRENVGLIFVSADKEGFEGLQEWKRGVVAKLEEEKVFSKLETAALSDPYLAIEVGFPGLRHFWYKSRQNVQVTMPIWDGDLAEDGIERRRLITTYQKIYDAIHARSGQSEAVKQMYIKTDTESCLGWITQPFELYVSVDSHLPKSSAVGAANAVARWVRGQEGRMFLREAPVF